MFIFAGIHRLRTKLCDYKKKKRRKKSMTCKGGRRDTVSLSSIGNMDEEGWGRRAYARNGRF